jgi:hypothetical protein
MNDVRDEALGTLLERVATGIESEPVDRLPEVLRHGSRRRAIRFTGIGAAIAVFVGAVSWAGLQNEGRETIPASIDDWDTVASLEDNGWTVQVPPPWRVQELPACPNAPERIGVIVTNVDFEFRNPRGESPRCEDRFVFQGFPSDGVAFAFMPVGIRWGVFQPEPRTRFPLTPGRLRHTSTLSGGASESFLDVGVKGELLAFVRRWVGQDAESDDVDALDRLLSSLRLANPPWVWTTATMSVTRAEVRHPSSFEARRFGNPIVIDAPTPILRLASPSVAPGKCGPGFWRHLGDGFAGLEDGDVVVVVSDATEAWTADYGARPSRFDISTAAEQGRLRCNGRPFHLLVWRFAESGRQIVLEMAVAEGARKSVEGPPISTILDSLRIAAA